MNKKTWGYIFLYLTFVALCIDIASRYWTEHIAPKQTRQVRMYGTWIWRIDQHNESDLLRIDSMYEDFNAHHATIIFEQ